MCDSAKLDDWMKEIPSGGTPSTFTSASPPKQHAGTTFCLHATPLLPLSCPPLGCESATICRAPSSSLAQWKLRCTFPSLCAAWSDAVCAVGPTEADSKFAAHSGILDAARAIVADLRETGVLRALFRYDPDKVQEDAIPGPPPGPAGAHSNASPGCPGGQ